MASLGSSVPHSTAAALIERFRSGPALPREERLRLYGPTPELWWRAVDLAPPSPPPPAAAPDRLASSLTLLKAKHGRSRKEGSFPAAAPAIALKQPTGRDNEHGCTYQRGSEQSHASSSKSPVAAADAARPSSHGSATGFAASLSDDGGTSPAATPTSLPRSVTSVAHSDEPRSVRLRPPVATSPLAATTSSALSPEGSAAAAASPTAPQSPRDVHRQPTPPAIAREHSHAPMHSHGPPATRPRSAPSPSESSPVPARLLPRHVSEVTRDLDRIMAQLQLHHPPAPRGGGDDDAAGAGALGAAPAAEAASSAAHQHSVLSLGRKTEAAAGAASSSGSGHAARYSPSSSPGEAPPPPPSSSSSSSAVPSSAPLPSSWHWQALYQPRPSPVPVEGYSPLSDESLGRVSPGRRTGRGHDAAGAGSGGEGGNPPPRHDGQPLQRGRPDNNQSAPDPHGSFLDEVSTLVAALDVSMDSYTQRVRRGGRRPSSSSTSSRHPFPSSAPKVPRASTSPGHRSRHAAAAALDADDERGSGTRWEHGASTATASEPWSAPPSSSSGPAHGDDEEEGGNAHALRAPSPPRPLQTPPLRPRKVSEPPPTPPGAGAGAESPHGRASPMDGLDLPAPATTWHANDAVAQRRHQQQQPVALEPALAPAQHPTTEPPRTPGAPTGSGPLVSGGGTGTSRGGGGVAVAGPNVQLVPALPLLASVSKSALHTLAPLSSSCVSHRGEVPPPPHPPPSVSAGNGNGATGHTAAAAAAAAVQEEEGHPPFLASEPHAGGISIQALTGAAGVGVMPAAATVAAAAAAARHMPVGALPLRPLLPARAPAGTTMLQVDASTATEARLPVVPALPPPAPLPLRQGLRHCAPPRMDDDDDDLHGAPGAHEAGSGATPPPGASSGDRHEQMGLPWYAQQSPRYHHHSGSAGQPHGRASDGALSVHDDAYRRAVAAIQRTQAVLHHTGMMLQERNALES